jgi:Tol biopolymer transport system component
MHRPAVPLLAFLLVAACTAAPAPSGDPSQAPPSSGIASTPSPSSSADSAGLHGQIAYVAGDDPQIFLLDLGTGESRQLTQLRAEHAELTASGPMRPALTCGFGPSGLAWSPDGNRLAFAYGSCDSVVYVVDLDGELRRIGDGRGPAWSHDGRLLVYGANAPWSPCGAGCQEPGDAGQWDLRIVDPSAGAEPMPLSADGSTSGGSQPVFSPDDSMIAFSGPPAGRDSEMETFTATYVIGADGTDPRHVVDGAWPVGWDPEGRLLIVTENASELHAIDLDDSSSTRIGTVQGPGGLSPDGTLVLETTTDPVTGAGGFRLATRDGEILLESPGHAGVWAPDSSAVAIVDLEQPAIEVIGRDGAALARYATEPTYGFALAWRPGS